MGIFEANKSDKLQIADQVVERIEKLILDGVLKVGQRLPSERRLVDKLQTAGRAAGLGEGLRASHWKDVFVAWAPSKNVSLTAAYVDLGTIVPATTAQRKQRGVYLSAQVAF